MKTTVEIPDGLFREARRYANSHDLTFREVVEAGLRRIVFDKAASREPFRLDKRSVPGDGMLKDYSWSGIRSLPAKADWQSAAGWQPAPPWAGR